MAPTVEPSDEEKCPSCNQYGKKEQMVQCEICTESYHLSCVGVEIAVRDHGWSCATCLIKAKSFIHKGSVVDTPSPQQTCSLKKSATIETKAYNELVQKFNKLRGLNITIASQHQESKTELEALKSSRAADAESLTRANEEIQILKDSVRALETDLRSRSRSDQGPSDTRQEPDHSESFSVKSSDDEESITFTPTLRRKEQRPRLSPLNVSNPKPFDEQAFTASILEKVSGLIKDLVPQSRSAPILSPKNPPSRCSSYSGYFDRGAEKGEADEREQSSVNILASSLNRKFIQSLPKYSGEVRDWAYFESVFNSTTAQGKYSELENVNRLREALQPPASTMVRSLIMFPHSATAIMNELREAYGRPELLNVALMREILDMRQSKGPQDTEHLRTLSLAVRNYVASMEAIGRPSELHNEFAMTSLAYKLSYQHQSEWEAFKLVSPGRISLKSFCDFLLKKVREIPPSLKTSHAPEPSTSRSSNDHKRRRVMTHQQAPQEKSKSGNFSAGGCLKCKENHPLFRCSEFLKLTVKDRYKFIFEQKICAACLQSDAHRRKECPKRRICGINGCDKDHNRALHNMNSANGNGNSMAWNNSNGRQRGESRSVQSNNERGGSNLTPQSQAFVPAASMSHQENAASGEGASTSDFYVNPSTHQMMTHQNENSVLFKIVPVRIHGENDTFVETFAFLDDGSSLTLLDKEIHNMLHLKGSAEQLHLQWTKGIVRTENALCTSISISARGSKRRHQLTNVYAVEHLDLPEQSVNVEALQSRYPHLRNLPLPETHKAKPKILIGLQHAKFLLGTHTHVGRDDDPIASKTQLGWTVFGQANQSFGLVALTNHKHSGVQLTLQEATRSDDELHKLVKSFFTTENFGVLPSTRDLVSAESERANEIMSRTMKFVGGRYEIGLLWKADNIKLPDSYPMAMNRLLGAEKTFKKKPALLKWKNDHVKDLLAKGYARKASAEELQQWWPRVWYTPTFVVFNANKKPPKPRDVADVAASVRGESLNSNLLKGPDNMAPLMSGLFKFRENFIAVNADVKEMFHQVKIVDEDQQCQRFLWRDGDDSQPPTVYVMQRMMFGPTCSPACAQYVKNTHAAKFTEESPEAVSALIRYTYVDDYFNSHASLEEALRVINDAFNICSSMGFDLVGVQSNCQSLLTRLPKEKVKSSIVSIDRQDADDFIAKVLGMYWQPQLDYFTYKMISDELVIKMLETDYQPTKREILRTLMKTFDPLGLISHYLVRGKIVLQEVWREGISWDEAIPDFLLKPWQDFIRQLPNIERLRIPRHYAPVVLNETSISLIVFVDASERAFAATAYLRFESAHEVHIAHVMAKTKVAPIKQLTIPQLELQAAVLGVRLAAAVKKLHSLDISDTRFLSDSKVVLSWICSQKYNFKTFVAARVGEILESSNRRSWFHVGTKDNVADDGTKWSDSEMGNNDTRWFKGPDFLKLPMNLWPLKQASVCDDDDEVKGHTMTMVHFPHAIAKNPFNTIDEIGARFTVRWTSLVRVVAYIRRIISRAKHETLPTVCFVTPIEFLEAEKVIFKRIQHEAFQEELQSLIRVEDGAQHSVFHTSKIASLSPFMKDGIIRMGSRSQKARVSYAAKNPIILPNKHPLVDVLVTHHHEKNFHMGEEMTIADLREKAWIVDVRAAVQRVKRNCQLCKILRAKPLTPVMGELPVPRIDFGVKAFTHVGLDAFGPYLVKYGRGSIKRYGLIFTCLTYRAVHLEVLNDMSTDLTIMAIRRFLVRRGGSVHFYSDRGTNFVGAKNLLHEDLKQVIAPLEAAVTKQFGIKWHIQPAYSPWWGGAWERLIQSIKKCIDFVMHEEIPREDIFLNAMIEAEFWMNRRPLTHTPINHEDAQPLTPNAVLFGDDQENLAATIGVFNVSDAHSHKAYRRSQHLVSKFLSRWNREYLPLINRRSKWFEKTHPIRVKDVVILTDPTQSKNAWKKGLVVRVYPGDDGIVRAADIQLADKSIKKNISVGRLAVLEVMSSPQ